MAAVQRGADHPALRVPVGGQGIVAGVHRGVAQGPGAVHMVIGIGHGQVVDIGVALTVVEPIEAGNELPVHGAVVGVLPGDGVELLARQGVDVLAPAQQVEQREGEEGFIAVIGAVHTRPHAALNEGAVRPGAVLDEGDGGAVHLGDEVALAHRPVGRRSAAVHGQSGEFGHVVCLSLSTRQGGSYRLSAAALRGTTTRGIHR